MKSSVVKNSPNARQVALQVCFQVIEKGQSLTQQLEQQLSRLTIERDRGFCSELSYGLCRYYFVLDQQLQKQLKKPLKARDRDIHLLLLMGLYQIRFMRVGNHAAVNESVKLVLGLKKHWAKGLVNAVLRAYIRQIETESQDQVGELTEQEHSLAYPDWIRKKLQQDWDEQAFAAMKAGNQQAPMVLRVDLTRISRSDYLQKLAESDITASAHPVIKQAVVLEQALAIDQLFGFENALVSVQDASAQIAADLLDCKTGMKVLDACAAPGGKTLHIMQASQQVQMTALDKNETRLQRVQENLQRAGLSAYLITADAAQPNDWFDGQLFDRVLLDAPCSASGIIRRHPDIRLLRKSQDIDSLMRQQQDLLQALWPLLKPGGLMVYSTCSMFKDENEYQLEKFMQRQSNCAERVINSVQWGQPRTIGRQILPGSHNMDGFYYACLEKTT